MKELLFKRLAKLASKKKSTSKEKRSIYHVFYQTEYSNGTEPILLDHSVPEGDIHSELTNALKDTWGENARVIKWVKV